MDQINNVRGYMAVVLMVALFSVFYYAVTEGFIFDAVWADDCAALIRGEAVSSADVDPNDYIEKCKRYER